MTVQESPLSPAEPVRGTRQRLDHIDAMRPVKQVGVVSTHTLLFFAPAAAGIAAGASLLLLHVTREAFLFVSACMLTYSFRDLMKVELRPFWRRRFLLVGIPYLCWTLIYFFFTLPTANSSSVAGAVGHLGYLTATGYYQLYYLLVILEFYLLFPLLFLLLRRTVGHHGALLAASGAIQVLLVSGMHWQVVPWWLQGFWATREVTSYQFYLLAGMVIALHLDEVHAWLVGHVRLVLGFTLASALVAEGWFLLAAHHVVPGLGTADDPFQPIVIPFNIGAIAAIYLLGVWLVGKRRSHRTRSVVRSGSDNSYGVYLAQLIFIGILSGLGWKHLNGYLPWPIVCLVTVVLVYAACVALTELLARTSLAKPLTGRTRIPWRTATPEPTITASAPAPATATAASPGSSARMPGPVDGPVKVDLTSA
jgi:peptidoglycan/LPS O-acetylase OafA/YrhL